MTAPFSLPELIAPISSEEFFSQYWESKPLHIRRAEPNFYAHLLTTSDLDAAISSGHLRYPAIQLAKGGTYFPAETYTRNIRSGDEHFTGVPDVDKIYWEYRAGATISLPAFQRASASVADLTSALEKYFDHAVQANAYITPGNAAGFTPHYDTHEVFVLQIGGRKHWRIYEPPLLLPHRTQPFNPHGYKPSSPLLEIDLNPGDLLYLPRGYVHTTSTLDSFSAHLTIAVTVYTWLELATELLQSSKAIPAFRKALPSGFASHENSREQLKEGLTQLIETLRQRTDYDEVLNNFLLRVRAGQIKHGGTFQADVAVIGPRTELMAPDNCSYSVTAKDGNVVLEFGGKALSLTPRTRSTLNEMCKRVSFCSEELVGDLSAESVLALVRYFHGEGFLKVWEDTSAR